MPDPNTTCAECGHGLTGRQRKFCSEKCKNAFWSKARGKPENDQEAMAKAFRTLVRDNKELIKRLLKEEE